MMPSNSNRAYAKTYPDAYELDEHENAFFQDLLKGLSNPKKELPCKYFYDETGSKLFTRICETEEYYVTRTECELMENILPTLSELIGSSVTIIEFGSGEGKKTQFIACIGNAACLRAD